MKPVVLNHPDHAPVFHGKKVQILNTIGQSTHIYRRLHTPSQLNACDVSTNEVTTQIRPAQLPTITLNQQQRNAFQTNNRKEITKITDLVNADLAPINDNIKHNPNAWVKVKDSVSGNEYYMAWSNKGVVWSWCQSIVNASSQNTTDVNAQYIATSQYGFLSQSTGITATCSYTIGLPKLVTSSQVAYSFAKCYSSFIQQGLSFNLATFQQQLYQYTSDLGTPLLVTVPQESLVGIVQNLTLTVSLLGKESDLQLSGRSLTNIQLFNWDPTNDWQITTQDITSNHFTGIENASNANLNLKAVTDSSNAIFPPGFSSPSLGNILVSFTNLIYSGHADIQTQTTPRVALQVTRAHNSNVGFTYGFNNSLVNSQLLVNKVVNPTQFLADNKDKFQTTPLTLTVTSASSPISASMTATQPNCDDNVLININNNVLRSAL